MKKNIIFTLFGIMCATGAVITDSIAACDVCASDGLTPKSDMRGALPWDDNSSAAGEHADQLVFWESCGKHQGETYSYYKCDTTTNGKCIYGRAIVYEPDAYPAQISKNYSERLICCNAPTNDTAKWESLIHTTYWGYEDKTRCAQVIAANDCAINNNAPIFRIGGWFSSTSCFDTAADENAEEEEQSPSETDVRPAACPEANNTCLSNVFTDAKLFANPQGATAAWEWDANRTYPEQRVMYWDDCGTRCLETYGCQADLNQGKFIYAPLHENQNTGLYNGLGAYAYKIIGSDDTEPLADQYKLLYCDASQNKWIKLTKADAETDTTGYTQITLGNKILYVSATDNISANTLWSTERKAPNEDGNSEEEQERRDEEEVEECGDDNAKIQAINSAMLTLNTFNYKNDTSVWTTAEGKFNTARLGTDIASGIAMGLTGGLVSNVIIKNKQVKQGIQGYQCTVGSEVIADYGDEFIVNLAY